MFALQYKDSFLELASKQSPLIKWVSTAFNDDDMLEGSGSFSIELANSPANAALLGFSTQLANRLARRDIEVTVFLMGQPWKRCTYSYNLKEGRPSGHLKIDNGELANKLKNISLPEIFVITADGVFQDHDWITLGSTWEQTILSMNSALPKGGAPFAFFPFINAGLFGSHSGDGPQDYDEGARIINRWVDTPLSLFPAGFLTGTSDPEKVASYWYSPSLYLVWVIRKVCRYLGYEAVGDFFDSEFINSLVIDNNSVYNITEVYSAEGFKIAPARHLPDIKIGDLFKKIRNQFKLVYYFNSNSRQVHFQFSSSVINDSERINLDGFIVDQKPSTEKAPETGYELVQPFDSKDELFKLMPYVKSFFIGETTIPKKVELPIGTTFMKYENNPHMSSTPIWRIPYKDQLGNAYGDKAKGSAAHNPEGYGRNQWDLRLISYQGLQLNENVSVLYPYATSDGIGTDNETLITDSCWLGGSRGILQNFQRLWYIFILRSEAVELSARLTSIILNKLSPLKKIFWATEEGVHLEAMMSQVEFTADERKQLLTSEIVVYPFYNQQASDLPGYSDFTGGEISNADATFVKMQIVEKARKYRKPFLAAKVLESIIVDVVYTFFSDPDGLVPKSVVNMKLNRVVHKTSTEGNKDTPYTYTVSGTSFAEKNLIQFYQKGGEKTSYTWTLSEGEYLKI